MFRVNIFVTGSDLLYPKSMSRLRSHWNLHKRKNNASKRQVPDLTETFRGGTYFAVNQWRVPPYKQEITKMKSSD